MMIKNKAFKLMIVKFFTPNGDNYGLPAKNKDMKRFLEAVFIRFVRGFSSTILPRTRQKAAGILDVFQGFPTRPSAKFAERTRAISCEYSFLIAVLTIALVFTGCSVSDNITRTDNGSDISVSGEIVGEETDVQTEANGQEETGGQGEASIESEAADQSTDDTRTDNAGSDNPQSMGSADNDNAQSTGSADNDRTQNTGSNDNIQNTDNTRSDNTADNTQGVPENTDLSQSAEAPQPADPISKLLESMTLEEKIGQVILARYTAESAGKAGECYFGGYTLYAADFEKETRESLKERLAPLYSALTVPPFIAADEEGGQVVRISKFPRFAENPLPPLYTAKDNIKDFAEKTAEIMKGAGANLNLAPVADVAESGWDYIYPRTFRSDYEETGRLIGELVTELNRAGVMCCLKHFPGYGSNVDTHTGIAVDLRAAADFEEKDFIPFKAGIKAGAPMVMINHNIVKAYNENIPASLAPEVHKVLRGLGFEGIIITDDLGMGAILGYTDDPYVDAFLAGNDLLCTSDGAGCFNSLYEGVIRGDIKEKRLDESVYRILSAKLRYGII